MKKILIPLLTLIVCVAGLWVFTNGFKTFTTFSHTLYKAGPLPRPLPAIKLINHDSTTFYIDQKDHYVLVNFMYINCPYACHVVNNKINEIHDHIHGDPNFQNLEIVTITFDPKNDNVAKIKNYRQNYSSDMSGWTFAIPQGYTPQQLQTILQQMGVWAYTIPQTQIINHSLYLFLISPRHQIVHIYDPARHSNIQITNSLNRYLHGQQG